MLAYSRIRVCISYVGIQKLAFGWGLLKLFEQPSVNIVILIDGTIDELYLKSFGRFIISDTGNI
jgi:hypothetical protein